MKGAFGLKDNKRYIERGQNWVRSTNILRFAKIYNPNNLSHPHDQQFNGVVVDAIKSCAFLFVGPSEEYHKS